MPRTRYDRRRSNNAVSTILALTVLVLIFIAALLFFKVDIIEVEGLGTYNAEDIISRCGVEQGDSLVFVKSDTVSENLRSSLVCVREVSIRKTYPSKLTIIISETTPSAVIQVDSEKWTIDETCKVIRAFDSTTDSNLIFIRGLDVEKAEVGSKLSVSSDNSVKLEHISNLLASIVENNAETRIYWLDVSSISNIRFLFDSRLTVEFGSCENVEYKMTKLFKIFEQLDPTDVGTVRLNKDGVAIFSPAE